MADGASGWMSGFRSLLERGVAKVRAGMVSAAGSKGSGAWASPPGLIETADLLAAAACGDGKEIRRLLEAGAAPDGRDTGNATALMRAAMNGSADCVEALLSVSDADSVDGLGRTALSRAAAAGHARCVELLLPVSAARSVDGDGMTAMMLAAENGRAECVELLLPVSDAKALDRYGQTVLMHAALGGSAECVRLLLPVSEAKAREGVYGWTALMLAASCGHAECARALLPKSDPGVRDKDGLTAADHARGSGREEVAAFLEGYARSLAERKVLEGSLPVPKGSGKPHAARRRV